jgi:hypothetical protein
LTAASSWLCVPQKHWYEFSRAAYVKPADPQEVAQAWIVIGTTIGALNGNVRLITESAKHPNAAFEVRPIR